MSKLEVGDEAPDFTLPSHLDEMVNLEDLLAEGKSVILYFYSANVSPICITEACAFRDNYRLFKEVGIEILGVSADSPASHMSFAEKLKIPFTLLSDEDGTVAKRYNVFKLLKYASERITFIIGSNGIIQHVFSDQFDGKGHVNTALSHLKLV